MIMILNTSWIGRKLNGFWFVITSVTFLSFYDLILQIKENGLTSIVQLDVSRSILVSLGGLRV